ncbi:MAG TPA: c-type cytochrome [Gammaproteobacteria bacterium]|nr:c-type cytochrome [Gammaproteobacteria bacterium]
MDIQDKSFLFNFSIVIGFLATAGVVFYIVAHIVAAGHYSTTSNDPLKAKLLSERLAPVGQVYIGKVPPSAQAPAAAKTANAKPMSGKEIWEGTCSACHKTGVAGAPPIGHKKEWAKHIAKGLATLKDHALHGYHGPEGFMPAKGGNPSLTDRQVVKAMEYMVSQSGGAALVKKEGQKILPPAK